MISGFTHYNKFSKPQEYVYKLSVDLAGKPHPFPRSVLEMLTFKNISPQLGTVIDLGSGPATSIEYFLRTYKFEKIILVDGSEFMLAAGKAILKNILHKDIITHAVNLENQQVPVADCSVDFVLSSWVALYLNNIDILFSEASRLLKPGGYFAVNIDVHDFDHKNVLPFRHAKVSQNIVLSYEHSLALVKQKITDENFKILIEASPETNPYDKTFLLRKNS